MLLKMDKKTGRTVRTTLPLNTQGMRVNHLGASTTCVLRYHVVIVHLVGLRTPMFTDFDSFPQPIAQMVADQR